MRASRPCSNAPGPPELDEDFLARLAGHVGQSVLAELAADGLIELTDRLNRLAELQVAGDSDAIARLGHDLVGMAGHLGLSRLSAAAAALNRAARADDQDGLADQVETATLLGAEAAAALRRYLDDLTMKG